MPELAAHYAWTFVALGVLFVLMAIQVFVEGSARNAAHLAPGAPTPTAGRPFVWRAERTRINTGEHAPLFAVMAVVGMAIGAPPVLVTGITAVFVATRIAFTILYYADIKLPRSGAFFLGSLATAGQALLVLVTAVRAAI